MSRPGPDDLATHHHLRGGDRLYENQRTVSSVMLDNIAEEIGRAGLMAMVEQELVRSVVDAAKQNGEFLDVPTVTWTCRVVGRTKGGEGAGAGGKSQVTGE